VRRGQRDEVRGVELRGIEKARTTEAVLDALAGAEAVAFCPSNPVVSIGPILALPGLCAALVDSSAPKVAVSPIVGGRALKGPADRMLSSLGHQVSSAGVARMYQGLVDGIVIDHADAAEREEIAALGMRVLVTDTIMRDEPGQVRLAREVLDFAGSLAA
jgi:LPPG:FO 2-phospho-L-lactate transferase